MLFLAQTCPKMDLRISKIYVRIQNQHLQDTMCDNFRRKQTALISLVQICSKTDLGLEIQKNNVRIKISILEISCVPIFRQKGQLRLFQPKFAKKWILG